MNRRFRNTAVVAGLAAMLLAAPAGAGADPGHRASGAAFALLRGAHFSPDTAGVDVYLTGFSGKTTHLWLADVGYGDVSPYRRLAAGGYTVSMRPHNAPASTPAALSWVLHARAGQAYTAAAVGMNRQLHGIVLHDALNPPAAGTGLVRVIQAASRAPKATIAAINGPVIVTDAAFATSTRYASVPAGTWPVRARSDTTPARTVTTDVRINSSSVSSIVLLDGKAGGLTLRTVVDAAGATRMPGGAVPAGGGGTAARPGSGLGWTGPAALLGALLLGCAITLHRNRAAR
jgi:hypothetical protein